MADVVEPSRFHQSDDIASYLAWCPGCDERHGFAVDPRTSSGGAVWSFDGNLESPTFSPSLGVKEYDPDEGEFIPGYKCHSFVKNGQWQFLSDSRHRLAGQTVPMIPVAGWPTDG